MSVPPQLPVLQADPRRAVGVLMTRSEVQHRASTGGGNSKGHRSGCRPGGCVRLCTSAGLADAYLAYRLPLLGRARAILRDAALAEDVVQETFVRAWRACVTFDPDGPPLLNWLSVIMRNVALAF